MQNNSEKMGVYAAPGIDNPNVIIGAVQSYTGVQFSAANRTIAGRKREYVEPRQVVEYLLAVVAELPPVQIAQLVASERSLVYKSVKIVARLIATDKKFRSKYSNLFTQFNIEI